MTLEAPLSRYKKQNLLIAIAVLFGLAVWCVYDGHYNDGFIEKHTDEDGNAQGWLIVNRIAPPYLVGGGVLLTGYYFLVRNKKVAADETGLKANGKTIDYTAIEKINKTYFESKGFFIVGYKDAQGKSCEMKLSDRTYDNLKAVLEHLVAKIS